MENKINISYMIEIRLIKNDGQSRTPKHVPTRPSGKGPGKQKQPPQSVKQGKTTPKRPTKTIFASAKTSNIP